MGSISHQFVQRISPEQTIQPSHHLYNLPYHDECMYTYPYPRGMHWHTDFSYMYMYPYPRGTHWHTDFSYMYMYPYPRGMHWHTDFSYMYMYPYPRGMHWHTDFSYMCRYIKHLPEIEVHLLLHAECTTKLTDQSVHGCSV